MSRSAMLMLAALLGLIAFASLGYTVWAEREKRLELETRVGELGSENDNLKAQISSYKWDVYTKLLSEETERLLDQIVTTDAQFERARLASQLSVDLIPLYIEYGAAEEIVVRLDALVEAPFQDERADIRDRLLSKVSDMSPEVDPDRFVSGGPVDAKVLSTLLTSLIALGTALGSFVTFLMSGSKRRIDDALAEIELEKAQIELTQMRYDAREAMNYMKNKPAEDLT